MKIKKIILSLLILWIAAGFIHATTNDVSGLLQKGLFEEEANRNLDAAIQAYQSVIAQTDKDHQFAATAIYRLGECYRKQGKTNEANIQFQRILHEFPDQTELAKLSREQRSLMFGNAVADNSSGGQNGLNSPATDFKEVLDNPKVIEQLKRLNPEQRRIFVQQHFSNTNMDLLMQKMTDAEQNLAVLKKNLGDNHPQVQAAKELLDTVRKQIDTRVEVILTAAETNTFGQPQTIHSFSRGGFADFDSPEAKARMAKEEEAKEDDEIKKIDAIIKDNPDLINSPEGWPFPHNLSRNPPLLQAVNLEKLKVAKFLLEKKADPNVRDQAYGQTPLILAAELGNTNMIALLLDHGADVNAAMTAGNIFTALHNAVDKGNKTVAEILLDHGAKTEVKDFSGQTPLFRAAKKGFKAMCELLLAHGADVNTMDNQNQTPFYAAVAAGNKNTAELLLAHKADVNGWLSGKGRLPELNGMDGSALTKQVEARNIGMVEFLLANKADISATNKDGATALHLAVVQGQLEMIKLLLDHGANIGARDKDGNTPLQYFPRETPDWSKTIQLLLDHGADINAQNNEGRTVLLSALIFNRSSIVPFLLANKANPSTPDKDGNVPLRNVIFTGDNRILADLLLDHGADVNAKGKDGYTALHQAVSKDYKDIVELLLAHHADVNAHYNGSTPLDMNSGHRSPNGIEIEKILRAHDGITEAENGTIRLKRDAADGDVEILFRKNNFSQNHYTLFEAIGMIYAPMPVDQSPGNNSKYPGIPFPDFSAVSIKRIDTNDTTTIITLDLSADLAKGDCSQDIPLKWGDMITIEQIDHKITEKWGGLSSEIKAGLGKCLHRKVQVNRKGNLSGFHLSPNFFEAAPDASQHSFWLNRFVRDANIIHTLSDLKHVMVKRTDAATGKTETITANIEAPDTPSLWLRDGDMIEIPEKR